MQQYNTNIRNNVLQWTKEEKAISEAHELVEHMGASGHLTNASILLMAARQAVAHHIMDQPDVSVGHQGKPRDIYEVKFGDIYKNGEFFSEFHEDSHGVEITCDELNRLAGGEG
jgi:hypothetical protein